MAHALIHEGPHGRIDPFDHLRVAAEGESERQDTTELLVEILAIGRWNLLDDLEERVRVALLKHHPQHPGASLGKSAVETRRVALGDHVSRISPAHRVARAPFRHALPEKLIEAGPTARIDRLDLVESRGDVTAAVYGREGEVVVQIRMDLGGKLLGDRQESLRVDRFPDECGLEIPIRKPL